MATVDEILTRQAYAAGDETWTKDNNYPSYTMYAEPEYVPVTNKRIADFNDQVSVRGEQNAQFVGFQLPRYDDAMDLTKQNLYIHYQTVYGGSDGVPCNVSWSDNYVRMCWMIPGQATQEPGSIQMMIYATGTNSVGDRTVWKTLPATYTIHDGLEIGGGIPEPDQSWYEQFVQQIEGKVSTAQGYANDAQASKVAAAGSATAAAQSADASAQALAENKDYVESQKETFVGYNKRESDLQYANALIGSASGTGRVTVEDAWGAPIPGVEVAGKSEQFTTTGAQLLNASNFKNNNTETTIADNGKTITVSGSKAYCCATVNIALDLVAGKQITLSGNLSIVSVSVENYAIAAQVIVTLGDGTKQYYSIRSASSPNTFNVPIDAQSVSLGLYPNNSDNVLNTPNVIKFTNIMVNAGSTSKPWEPYTGGKSSPSPDYPQPIISTGTVTTGAQLLDLRNSQLTFNGLSMIAVSGIVTISGTSTADTVLYYMGGASNTEGLFTLPAGDYFITDCRLINYDGTTKTTKAGHVTFAEPFVVTAVVTDLYPSNMAVNTTLYPMVNAGTSPKPWEPYTGGKPSPSEEYPQPLDIIIQNKNMTGPLLPGAVDMDGTEISRGNAIRSGYIRIDPGMIYTFSRKKTFSATLDTCMARIFNLDKVFLGSMTIFNRTDLVKTISDGFQYAGASYIRLVQFKSTDDTFDGLDLQMEEGNSATDYVSPVSQAATIQLTAPLYGIGEHKDRITMTKRIDRCVELIFDGSEDWRVRSWSRPTTSGFYALGGLPEKMRARPGLCNQGTVTPGETEGVINQIWLGSSPTYGSVDLYVMNNSFYNPDIEDKGLAAWKAHLASHPLKIVTYLDTPVETDLPAATQTALNALTTFTGTTHITITAGGPEPDVAVEYVQDTKAVIADLQAQINAIRNGGTT